MLSEPPTTSHEKSWYAKRQYLEHGTMPSHFFMRNKRAIQLKAWPYHLVHGVLYRKHHNIIFLKYLDAQGS